MRDTESLAIVVPVYRNQGTLAALHAEIRRALAGSRPAAEILFVVDGSPDDSVRVLERIAADDDAIRVLELAKNHGQNWAVLAGLARARGSLIAIMDADLQDPPAALDELLAAMEEGVEVVFAGRRGAYESPTRLLSSRLFKRTLTGLSGGALPPDAGLFLLMRREVAAALLEMRVRDPYVVGMIGAGGFRTRSVPVVRQVRPSGSSSYGFLSRARLGVSAIRILLSSRGAGRSMPTARSIVNGIATTEWTGEPR